MFSILGLNWWPLYMITIFSHNRNQLLAYKRFWSKLQAFARRLCSCCIRDKAIHKKNTDQQCSFLFIQPKNYQITCKSTCTKHQQSIYNWSQTTVANCSIKNFLITYIHIFKPDLTVVNWSHARDEPNHKLRKNLYINIFSLIKSQHRAHTSSSHTRNESRLHKLCALHKFAPLNGNLFYIYIVYESSHIASSFRNWRDTNPGHIWRTRNQIDICIARALTSIFNLFLMHTMGPTWFGATFILYIWWDVARRARCLWTD